MNLSATDRQLITALEEGLPLTARPYDDLGQQVGLCEDEVIARLTALLECGALKRLGLIVNHRQLGYTANAMIVWDVPESQICAIGAQMSAYPFVTLCYRRTRRARWPYNLYCMIHGRNRQVVEAQADHLAKEVQLTQVPRQMLFSRRCFRQRGARYASLHDDGPLQIRESA